MICLGTHMQDATGRLGAGAVLAHRTRGTSLGGKNDFHGFPRLAEAATLLPLRTGRLLLAPIDGEMRQIEALARFGLPTAVRHRGTQQFEPSLSTAYQHHSVDRAR